MCDVLAFWQAPVREREHYGVRVLHLSVEFVPQKDVGLCGADPFEAQNLGPFGTLRPKRERVAVRIFATKPVQRLA